MALDIKRIKVVAFDVFGTLVRIKDRVPHDELKAYADHIRKPDWSPLVLPKSWEDLTAFEDVRTALSLLSYRFMVVTLSNGPLGLQANLLKNNRIAVHAIVPLELAQVFKPNPRSYLAAAEMIGIPAEHWLMVSANKTFGDIEASRSVGMQSQLVRCEEMVDLDELVCELSA